MRIDQNPAHGADKAQQNDADETQDEMDQQPHGPGPRAEKPSSKMSRTPLGKGFPAMSGKLPNAFQAPCPMAGICRP
jgi:hypothetical protein